MVYLNFESTELLTLHPNVSALFSQLKPAGEEYQRPKSKHNQLCNDEFIQLTTLKFSFTEI